MKWIKGTFVTVHGARAADFQNVFGTATVAVKGWRPTLAYVPGHGEPQSVFELDLKWVEQNGHREPLVNHLAKRFGESAEMVDREIDRIGVPMLAENCVISSTNREFL